MFDVFMGRGQEAVGKRAEARIITSTQSLISDRLFSSLACSHRCPRFRLWEPPEPPDTIHHMKHSHGYRTLTSSLVMTLGGGRKTEYIIDTSF